MAWGERVIEPVWVAGRNVLEVGSYDVNGSLRSLVENYGPASYTGVDMQPGPGVNVVMDACDVEGSYGLVVCTETLEHVANWRDALHAIKACVAPMGHLVLTTRSPGFPWHPFPHDYWRFTVEMMGRAVADMREASVVPDPEAPGVFVLGSGERKGLDPVYELDAEPAERVG